MDSEREALFRKVYQRTVLALRVLDGDNLSSSETYRRLIDVYRLRADDSYVYGGREMHWASEYCGKKPIDYFKRYIRKLQVAEMLPYWWNRNRTAECYKLAKDPDGDSFIGHSIDPYDIEERYNDNLMVDSMRAVAEDVYETDFDYKTDPAIIRNLVKSNLVNKPNFKAIPRLPRQPGHERKPYYELGGNECETPCAAPLDTALSNTALSNTAPSNTIPSITIPSDTAASDTTLPAVSDPKPTLAQMSGEYALVRHIMNADTFLEIMERYGVGSITDLPTKAWLSLPAFRQLTEAQKKDLLEHIDRSLLT